MLMDANCLIYRTQSSNTKVLHYPINMLRLKTQFNVLMVILPIQVNDSFICSSSSRSESPPKVEQKDDSSHSNTIATKYMPSGQSLDVARVKL